MVNFQSRPFLRITKTGNANPKGLQWLKLARAEIRAGTLVEHDHLLVYSGSPSAQVFRTGGNSPPGLSHPIPEGYYSLGPVEFASGVVGDYSKNWPVTGDGLGPVWVGIEPRMPTQRSALGFHEDHNSDFAVGTDGCVGLPDRATLRALVAWFADPRFRPKQLTVNYRLGTVETTLRLL